MFYGAWSDTAENAAGQKKFLKKLLENKQKTKQHTQKNIRTQKSFENCTKNRKIKK